MRSAWSDTNQMTVERACLVHEATDILFVYFHNVRLDLLQCLYQNDLSFTAKHDQNKKKSSFASDFLFVTTYFGAFPPGHVTNFTLITC